MAKIVVKPKLDVEITFTIDESEANALDAMAGYGDNAFIKAFYDTLGKSYMEQHEDGLRKFLTSIRDVVGPGLYQLKQVRTFLNSKNKEKRLK